MADHPPAELKRTVLHADHVSAKGRMVEFGGYSMPVQYEGVLAEHRWTRQSAGLFDVSHMGPSFLTLNDRSGDGQAEHEAVAAIIEPLVCGDIRGLKPGQIRYTLLMNEEGGVLDDLMIGRPAAADRQGMLYVIVNAGTKEGDFQRIGKQAGGRAALARADDRGLLALQGPKAVEVLEAIVPGVSELAFMQFRRFEVDGHGVVISRSGYTGEDGCEILVPAAIAGAFWARLLEDDRVRPIGLGARDSLRLEAGLPLYGHDLNETTSPVEANLTFALNRRRRQAADFPGATRVLKELGEGPRRLRVGLKLASGGAPAREGAEVTAPDGTPLGMVTSGGPSPSLGYGIAMAYLPPAYREPGRPVNVMVRGKPIAAETTAMPFFPHRYVRQAAKPASQGAA